MKTINFTRAKFYDLEGAYQKARQSGHDQFEFEGQKVLTAYAKYLIEYLRSQFRPDTQNVTHPFGVD
jgi:hypothetical protein